MADCELCEGSGVCPACDGTGYPDAPAAVIADSGGVCATCAGDRWCPHCSGAGEVGL